MMKKLVLIFVFFLGVFLFASIKAGNAHAVTVLHAVADNTSSTIPITVYYYYTSTTSRLPTITVTVPVGSTADMNYAEAANNQPYQLTWWTDCTDPTVDPVGSFDVIIAYYDFGSQDVVCRTTNSEPQITNTYCAGFDWTLVGVGSNGANISRFDLFRSQSPDTNPDDNFIGSVGSATRSVDWGSLSPGTYYVRVSAVSPQGLYSRPAYTNFTCAQAPPGAPSLSSPVNNNVAGSCQGDGTVTVTFSWSLGSNATSHELHLDGDNQLDGVDEYIPLNVGNNTSNTQTGLLPSRYYQWRIRAFNSGGFTDSTGNGTFQTPNCPGPTPTPPPPGAAPTVDITANGSQGPITVTSGSSVTLRWITTNSPTSCTASGAWSGSKATGGGSQSVIVSTNSTFNISCSNSNGSGSDSVTVNVSAVATPTPPPVCAGSISGSKWSDTDSKPFDTANGLPGSTVRLDGGVQTDGPQTVTNERNRLREFCKLFLSDGLNCEFSYLFGLKNA